MSDCIINWLLFRATEIHQVGMGDGDLVTIYLNNQIITFMWAWVGSSVELEWISQRQREDGALVLVDIILVVTLDFLGHAKIMWWTHSGQTNLQCNDNSQPAGLRCHLSNGEAAWQEWWGFYSCDPTIAEGKGKVCYGYPPRRMLQVAYI